MDNNRSAIAAIVLAAGRSRRMGQHKLLLPLGGRPLVSYAVAAANASDAAPVVVVLGYQADEVQAALPAGRQSIHLNDDFAAGMAGSLRLGIHAVSSSAPSVKGALILLADQPLISTELINHLLHAAAETPNAIIAATYAGQRSTPVYFPSHLFGELLQITGDEGGRSVIACHPELLRLEAIEDATLGLDVDQPAEYEHLCAIWDCYSAR